MTPAPRARIGPGGVTIYIYIIYECTCKGMSNLMSSNKMIIFFASSIRILFQVKFSGVWFPFTTEPLSGAKLASTRGPAQVLPSCHHAHGKLNIVVLFYSLGLAICPFLFLAFVTSDVSAVGCIVTVAASLLLFHLVLLLVFCQLLEHENKRIFPESSIFEVAMASTQTSMLLLFMELSNCTMICFYT